MNGIGRRAKRSAINKIPGRSARLGNQKCSQQFNVNHEATPDLVAGVAVTVRVYIEMVRYHLGHVTA